MIEKEQIFKIGTDQKHLNDKSYKTAEKLDVRILTHKKYTHPPFEFYPWVLDQIDWNGDEIVFDIGCGSAKYANAASQRCGRYVACDLSHGMLKDGAAIEHDCINLDAMALPLPDQSADVVFANHMIYHVPDQAKAVAQFRRILKPSGKLIAVTNSSKTMQELKDLRLAAVRSMGLDVGPAVNGFSIPFNLEDGADVLETSFEHVEQRIVENWLVFPNPQPIIDYIASSKDWYKRLFPSGYTWEGYEAALRRILDAHFAQHSEFQITKKTGAFVCW